MDGRTGLIILGLWVFVCLNISGMFFSFFFFAQSEFKMGERERGEDPLIEMERLKHDTFLLSEHQDNLFSFFFLLFLGGGGA